MKKKKRWGFFYLLLFAVSHVRVLDEVVHVSVRIIQKSDSVSGCRLG